ncbi:MAG: hypothetical protein DDT40_01715 [candidate division WS2 bacterium]|nr:hypothetical protein [Candidatus Psychracetigena formicireducens]
MSRKGNTVLTIGHSNHSIDTFLSILKANKVEVVVDVRSHPYSKYVSHFNSSVLKSVFESNRIKYIFLGKELGGQPEGSEFYDEEQHVLYNKVAESRLFNEGLLRLEKGINMFTVAVMCSEENPAYCHRRLLISRVLHDRGFNIIHVRGDGNQLPEQTLQDEESTCVQLSLFDVLEVNQWRSIQSVSQRKLQKSSSEYLEKIK